MRIQTSLIIGLFLFGCAQMAPQPYEPSSGHISADQQPPVDEQIPALVGQTLPELPEPQPQAEQEKYTVVVNEVPVKEILFALARDAKINVDVDPRVDGVVTLNAVDQTLPQLLDRIARQTDIRYELNGNNLFISPDEPFLRTYKVEYVNLARDTTNAITIATEISGTSGGGSEGSGGGGGGGNNSTTAISSVSNNRFWSTLVQDVQAILGEESTGGSSGGEVTVTQNVIPHPESGILTVRATAKQHQQIQRLIDMATESAHRQVLIQATIAEVTLKDQYQAGIDWSLINNGKAGFDFVSTTLTGVPLGTLTSFLLKYKDPNPDRERVIDATLRLLEEFGNVRVLSSPQIMTLNSQTAILKVVDNVVYFSVESQIQTTANAPSLTTVQTTVHTVPVGIVMSVTPQISENDSVILNIRPTISRIADRVQDPNPQLNLPNFIPQIAVREMESLLRVNNGQIAVLGGLMTDTSSEDNTAIPGLSKLPGAGEAFKTRTRDFQKAELVIFLRPVVIRNPSIDGDLRQYRTFLQQGR